LRKLILLDKPLLWAAVCSVRLTIGHNEAVETPTISHDAIDHLAAQASGHTIYGIVTACSTQHQP
jgi:hypothetical protein